MPDERGGLTREEVMEQYGIDPVATVTKEAPAERGILARYGSDVASGFLSAWPTVLALPETVYAGGEALYNSYANDTPFMQEFKKSITTEDAQKNITAHLNQVAAGYIQADPNLSQEDVYKKLDEYQHSKQFEDFSMSQLKGGIGAFAKIQDTARGLTGDERTDEQRDWTDTAAEVVGGALMGGPVGVPAKIASSAAKNVISKALLNNPVSRTAIKAAELTTPVTIPFTPTNVAANAVVGVGIDEAIRYGRGQDTAFAPKTDDSFGVGALATGTAGIVGTAAFFGAIRGRSKELLQSEVVKAMKDTPGVSVRTSQNPKPGEAIIAGGREQQLGPSSMLNDMPLYQSAPIRAKGQYLDQAAPMMRVLHENQPERMREFEAIYHTNTDSVLEDQVLFKAQRDTSELFDSINSQPIEQQRATMMGMVASSIVARARETEDVLVTRITELERKGMGRTESTALTQARKDLQRLRDDNDATARQILPQVPPSQLQAVAHAYERDMAHATTRTREAHKEWADKMMKLNEEMGTAKSTFAAERRIQDPYFVPIQADPLGGATGIARAVKGIVRSVKRAQVEGVEGAGRAIMHEDPIREFKKVVPDVHDNVAQETRITAIQDPRTAILNYTKNMYRAHAQQISRNQLLEGLQKNHLGEKSNFLKDGHMRIVRNPSTGDAWTDAEKVRGNPALMKIAERPNVVPEWNGGRVRFWEFGDVEFPMALRHDPVKMSGMMQNVHTVTNWFKYFTTGPGNPVFAITGALYNIAINILTRRADRAYGTISFLAHVGLPKWVAREVFGRIPDPTPLITWPYHALAGFTEFVVHVGAQKMMRALKGQAPFDAFRAAVGEQRFEAILKATMRVASWAENTATLKMMESAATRGVRSLDNTTHVRGAYAMAAEQIPQAARGAYNFYKGALDAVYLGGSRPFYVQNHYLLNRQYKGNIPPGEMTKLIHESRTVGGDMSLVPASKTMRDLESWFPYLSQTKLGAYHLYRNMFGAETALYVLPRMTMALSAIAASYYWRTYWDEASRKEFWGRPEYDRWRLWDLPHPNLIIAWVKGENPAFNRKLIYSLKLPPDITGPIAGAVAFLQMVGAIPSSATPKPIAGDLPKIWLDSLTPAMPPLLQAVLAMGNMKLDPQNSDTRGGNMFRSFGSAFRAGPQAESATNLGEISNGTSLMLNALFGAMGSYLASSTDVLLHASKFDMSSGKLTPRQQTDFAAGMRAATSNFKEKVTAGIPDIPLLWQNTEKYKVMTPAWQFVANNNQHIKSIVGVKTSTGKAAQRAQQGAANVGGIPQQQMTDQLLLAVADDVSKFQNPSGPLGQLKKQNVDLTRQNHSVLANYMLSQEEKTRRSNYIISKLHENQQQQHLAIRFLEQSIADKYGQQLAPRLRGRKIDMATLDAVMRENFGSAPAPQGDAATAQEQ